jgi:hypothetical protein
MLCRSHMSATRYGSLLLTLAVGLLFSSPALRAQTPRAPGGQVPERSSALRAPQGANPGLGAALPDEAPGLGYGVGEERDAERLFAWVGPFEPLLKPGQIVSFRQLIKERLGEMRVLENRRRTLVREVLQLSVTADAKTEKVREKATALGQVVTELAMQHAEILRSIQPALSNEQRVELRTALARMLADGYEPFSFGQPQTPAAPPTERSLPELLGYPSPMPFTPGSPGVHQPRQAPQPPRPPGAPSAPANR